MKTLTLKVPTLSDAKALVAKAQRERQLRKQLAQARKAVLDELARELIRKGGGA